LLDKYIIRDEVLNMLVAGRDTVCEVSSHLNSLIQPIFQTAATLTYAVYMLAEHPTMADRLRNEILDKVGTSKVPTHDDIKAMPYLRAFINGSTIPIWVVYSSSDRWLLKRHCGCTLPCKRSRRSDVC
jgi:hypothetical protein